MRTPVVVLVSFVAGGALAIGVVTAFPSKREATAPPTRAPEAGDDDALRKANDNLTASLQACDRNLAELRDRAPAAPQAPAAPDPAPAERERDGGRFGRRRGGETTKEDWERMAQLGVVRVRIPCLRDKPWAPSERVMNRLGLAPQDGEVLREAYEKSNKRVADQIKPLCAKVLGSAEMAEKVGPSTCMDAISNSERKTNAEGAKLSLTRAAEVQAGKRQAPSGDVAPLEQLAGALANESKAFERDLAARLGPEEAKRLANAPELCSDRRTLRASDDREER